MGGLGEVGVAGVDDLAGGGGGRSWVCIVTAEELFDLATTGGGSIAVVASFSPSTFSLPLSLSFFLNFDPLLSTPPSVNSVILFHLDLDLLGSREERERG